MQNGKKKMTDKEQVTFHYLDFYSVEKTQKDEK